MADFCHIKYLHRQPSNYSDKQIAWMYENCPQMMDATLIAANGLKVKAHAYVLSLFSKYFEEKCDEGDAGWKIEIPLPNMSYEVVQNVVRLFYFREIFVPNDLKEKMVEALKFLRTFDINVLEEGKRSEAMKMVSPQKQAAKISQRRNTMAVMPENAPKRKIATPMQVEASSQNGASMNAVNAIGRNFSQMNIQKAKPKIVNTATVPIAMAIQQKKVVTKTQAKPAMPSELSKQPQMVLNESSNQNGAQLVKANAIVPQLNAVKVVSAVADDEETVGAVNEEGVIETEGPIEQELQEFFPGQDLLSIFPTMSD